MDGEEDEQRKLEEENCKAISKIDEDLNDRGARREQRWGEFFSRWSQVSDEVEVDLDELDNMEDYDERKEEEELASRYMGAEESEEPDQEQRLKVAKMLAEDRKSELQRQQPSLHLSCKQVFTMNNGGVEQAKTTSIITVKGAQHLIPKNFLNALKSYTGKDLNDVTAEITTLQHVVRHSKRCLPAPSPPRLSPPRPSPHRPSPPRPSEATSNRLSSHAPSLPTPSRPSLPAPSVPKLSTSFVSLAIPPGGCSSRASDDQPASAEPRLSAFQVKVRQMQEKFAQRRTEKSILNHTKDTSFRPTDTSTPFRPAPHHRTNSSVHNETTAQDATNASLLNSTVVPGGPPGHGEKNSATDIPRRVHGSSLLKLLEMA